MLEIFESEILSDDVEFYLGGYGAFDEFVYRTAIIYKKTHPKARLILITPYLDKKIPEPNFYDYILYPEIESVPKRFAIIRRNKYMMEKADLVIAYVSRSWGGAYESYVYAEKKGKRTINFAETSD